MASSTRGRARRGSLDRGRIVDAAERLIRSGDYETLSMRALAAELGVAPMSLYGHVRDKDDLLDEVVDRLLESRWKPRVSKVDWRVWIIQAADRLRELLISEPVALHVYLSHPVVSPSAIRRMEMMLEVLATAGLSGADAEHAYAAIHTYTVGFAALEASRAKGAQDSDRSEDPLRSRLSRFTTGTQFRRGLSFLLAGVVSQRGTDDDRRR